MFKILFIIGLLFSADEQIFKVEFLGVPAARVELHELDTLYNKQNSKMINFKTRSSGLIKYIFNVDNVYNTILSQDFKNIFAFNKETIQPNVSNKLQTSLINNKVVYDNSQIEIPNGYFNIFSLLYFLSNNKILKTQNMNIEREGELYSGVVTPITIFDNNTILYELELVKKDANDNYSAIKNTDIFTWALFKKKSTRSILVDYNNNNIIKCIFANGRIKMIAKNIKYDE